MFNRLVALACFCVCIYSSGLLASETKPTLQQAVGEWLEGDEVVALTNISFIANANIPSPDRSKARILLSRIEKMTKNFSSEMVDLGKVNRSEILRAPLKNDGSPFRPSWLEIESQNGSKVASLLKRSKLPITDLCLIEALNDIGERQATDYPTRIAALYGTQEQRDSLLSSNFLLDELRPYVTYLRVNPELSADGFAALRHIVGKQNLSLDPEDPDTFDMSRLLALGTPFTKLDPANKWRKALNKWLLNNEAAIPLLNTCKLNCGSEAEQLNCATTMLAMSGGYYELIRLDSPLETVIPQRQFLNSKRAQSIALRNVAVARQDTDVIMSSIPEIRSFSSCLAPLVEAERSKNSI